MCLRQRPIHCSIAHAWKKSLYFCLNPILLIKKLAHVWRLMSNQNGPVSMSINTRVMKAPFESVIHLSNIEEDRWGDSTERIQPKLYIGVVPNERENTTTYVYFRHGVSKDGTEYTYCYPDEIKEYVPWFMNQIR